MNTWTVNQSMPREPEIRAYAPIDQPDTSCATLRAEVLAAARAVVLAYEASDYQMTGSLIRRLDTLREQMRAFDAASPGEG
jgi:hypothetical protein